MRRKSKRQTLNSQRLSLKELAKRTQCTPRTIRFYIARGLVPGPLKAGRDAYYGEEHVSRLEWIRRWQRQGLTLAEIAARLSVNKVPPIPTPTVWWSYALGTDVVVQVRAGLSPWRLHRILKGLQQLAQYLLGEQMANAQTKESHDESND